MNDRPTVREEIAEVREHVSVMKNDVGWIKRAVLGLYALVGTLVIALVAALTHGGPPGHVAETIFRFLT